MNKVEKGKYGKAIFKPEHLRFIKENYKLLTNTEMAKALGVGNTSVRVIRYQMGLYRQQLEYWTPEQVAFLKKWYQVKGDTELATEFAERWHKDKGWSKKHIEKKRRYLKLKRTAAQIKAIKKRNVQLGMFKDCPVKAWQTRGGATPVGTLKIWSGQAVIKTKTGFVHYNRWLFTNTYFTLPSSVLVITKSGNIIADGPEDLKIITRAEHAKRNRLPKELRPTKSLLLQLQREL
ncbi:hypothetical protein [Croceivirga sp. JEA036]|uniref:hypothetical protein n=1 Tax=Croceivirga sp. JEA036 TaxID=2721162 RepID=UPI00143C22A9|nr:hypothetical protein [Croceivirga sp. JEA036]NJB36372.1 hypothetical protein [Croceivirga sp. JEA036]